MTTKADLAELLERVEKRDGPDRGLDARVMMAVTGGRRSRYRLPGVYAVGGAEGLVAPELTSSVDAALGLVELLLPGFGWEVRKNTGFLKVAGTIYTPDDPNARVTDPWPPRYEALGSTPALAVCAALLRALIAQEEASHPSGRAGGGGA